MPKIISYTPSWLTRPNPGFYVFNDLNAGHLSKKDQQPSTNGNTNEDEWLGPNRTIVHRGAEVFVVVKNQIRWADLSLLKEGVEQHEATPSKGPRPTTNGHKEKSGGNGPEDGSYRILKVGIHEQIRQLSISPNGKLLAIATSHNVHLAILPDSSHLGQLPNKPIKLKTSTIGRTTHVVNQSPIASILWHPCGLSGNCLVTVTTDAAVRLWEFNESNRWASDTPSLAIDLKKLALGTSSQDDFAPDRGRNRAFSPDSVGMEVASACFGGTGSSNESAWSSMTLWVAMRAGDIYAICPLSPLKWQAPSTMLPSLSTVAVAKATAIQDEDFVDAEVSRQYRDQYDWIQELDGQEAAFANGGESGDASEQVYSRPTHPAPIPKLQGPFQIFSEEIDEDSKEVDVEFSDIYVIPSKMDNNGLDMNEEEESEPEEEEYGLSVSLICLMTRKGIVYVTLDLEGVEGQWLPSKKPDRQTTPQADPYLVVLEGLETFNPREVAELEWPTFSSDVDSSYTFFTTHSRGVFYFSFDPWLQSFEKEIQNCDPRGTSFRLGIVKEGPETLRQRVLSFDQVSDKATSNLVPACLAIEDSDLGYFLLTTCDHEPQAATLDRPYYAPAHDFASAGDDNILPNMDNLAIGPARSTYQPASAFYIDSSLPSFITTHVHARHRHLVKHQVRLSPATLDLMTDAHRLLSKETHQLGVAAADLFRRCDRLVDELRDQIGRVHECSHRTSAVKGMDNVRRTSKLQERVQRLGEKQAQLQERHETLRKKLHGAGGRKLSDKEKAWAKEVDRTEESVKEKTEAKSKKVNGQEEGGEDVEDEDEGEYEGENRDQPNKESSTGEVGVLRKRLGEVQQLKEELLAHAKEITASSDDHQAPLDDDQQLVIPRDLRARKMAQVMDLLERESTMVDAATRRLKNLTLASVK